MGARIGGESGRVYGATSILVARAFHTCSSELVSKISNPKMSTYAICGPADEPYAESAAASSYASERLMCATSHAKRHE